MILKRSSIQVFWMLGLSLILAALISLALSAPALAQDATETPEPVVPGPDAQCPEATVVQTATGTGNKQTEPFNITGDRFRLTVTVEPTSSDPSLSGVTVNVVDAEMREGVTSFSKEGAGTESSVINEGPGRFFLDTNTANANYAVTVEDCNSDGGSGGGSGSGNGNSGDQYSQGQDVEITNIINIPSKGLPKTGGPPLLAILFSVAAGAGLLTAVVRRRY